MGRLRTNDAGTIYKYPFFSSVSSVDEAAEIGRYLFEVLSNLGELNSLEVKRCWKILGYYECAMELRAPSLSDAILSSVMDELGSGWQGVGMMCFVWSRSEKNHFADERVNWAEVELVDV